MKFTVKQGDFSKALSIVNRSLPAKANLPILSTLLVSASKNELEILSTNLETATRVVLPCVVAQEGKTAISGRVLTEYVSQLPEGDVVLEKLGEEVSISTGSFSARFSTMLPDDFPAIPKIEKGYVLKIPHGDFVNSVDKVGFSAAQDEGRPILTGVLCEFAKSELSLVATDGYRLSFHKVSVLESEVNTAFKIVVPARTLMEVSKVLGEIGMAENKNNLTVLVSENLNQVNFKVDSAFSIEFISRLIEGDFPNWQKIIPSEFTTRTKISKAEFIRLIKIASIFARNSGNIIRLKLDPASSGSKNGTLSIFATANQVGSSDVKGEIEITGSGGEIAFNFRYLLEVLAVMEDEDVNFEMIESLNPGKITGQDEKDSFFHIIMPVRLQS